MEAVIAPPKRAVVAGPTAATERIGILDSLRGIAILGILLMNISAFGYPTPDPTVFNETGANYYTWYSIAFLFNGTQRALFSMLFGAGIILFVQHAEKKSQGMQPADYFFRRQLWLIVFSLFDVFVLLWYGDILLDYALFGMLLFTFRNMPARSLLIAAGICLLLMLARENRDFFKDKNTVAKGEAIAALDTTKTKLTPEQKKDLAAMVSIRENSTIEKKKEKAESDIRNQTADDYATIYEYRSGKYVDVLTQYLFFELWDVLLFMFLGMAFYKMGILTGNAPVKIYWWMMIMGLGAGLLLSYQAVDEYIRHHFNRYNYIREVPFKFYQLERALRSLGLFAAIMLLYTSGAFKWLFSLMQPVGRMAFTNYLSQSLICLFIFSGLGWSLYGQLERHQLYYIVGCIWIFQIAASHLWLRYFRYGPFEWAWRCLTYWKKQPFLK